MHTLIKQYRMVLSGMLNNNGTLFGGQVLQWMDEAAYIAAVRHCNKKVVTAKIRDMQFILPLQAGMIAEIQSRIIAKYGASMDIHIEIYAENIYTGESRKAAEAVFTMAAVNDALKVERL